MLAIEPMDINNVKHLFNVEQVKLFPMRKFMVLYNLLEDKINIPYANFLKDLHGRYTNLKRTEGSIIRAENYQEDECNRAVDILMAHTEEENIRLVELHNQLLLSVWVLGHFFKLYYVIDTIVYISKNDKDSTGFSPKNLTELKIDVISMMLELRTILYHRKEIKKKITFTCPENSIIGIILKETELLKWDTLDFDKSHFDLLEKLYYNKNSLNNLLRMFHTGRSFISLNFMIIDIIDDWYKNSFKFGNYESDEDNYSEFSTDIYSDGFVKPPETWASQNAYPPSPHTHEVSDIKYKGITLGDSVTVIEVSDQSAKKPWWDKYLPGGYLHNLSKK